MNFPLLLLMMTAPAANAANGDDAATENHQRHVRIVTNQGNVELSLDAGKAPITVENFIAYAESGHYDGTVFHRVIDGFMIQGGGFTPDMKMRDTRPPIRNEADNGLSNVTGTIAMARTSVPHSATSQFFINVKDNLFLDHRFPQGQGWGYCVFGEVTSGMDVVMKIAKQPTGTRGGADDVPLQDVIIERVEVLR